MTDRDLVLMCGAGGATKGLEAAGWNPAVAVDYWEAACLAHRKWLPHGNVVRGDVREVHRMLRGPYRFAWASPSCKPWSCANRTPKRGKVHPEYYSLAFLVEQVFDHLKCRWLIIENVGGLVWSKEGRVEVEEFRQAVAARGLCLSMPKGGGTIASNTLGVAQLRRRVFLVVGPAYVSIRPGGELIPPAGCPPMLWETEEVSERMIGGGDHERGKASDLRRASTAAILKDDHPTKWSDAYRFKRAEAGAVLRGDRGEGKDHNWPRRAERGMVDASRHRSGLLYGFDSETRAKNILRAEAGQVASDNGTGRTLEACCELQQIPFEVVSGFSKRVAHELVGNVLPWRVAQHLGALILRADSELSR